MWNVHYFAISSPWILFAKKRRSCVYWVVSEEDFQGYTKDIPKVPQFIPGINWKAFCLVMQMSFRHPTYVLCLKGNILLTSAFQNKDFLWMSTEYACAVTVINWKSVRTIFLFKQNYRERSWTITFFYNSFPHNIVL